MIATLEFVVPRSMPTTRPMSAAFPTGRRTQLWQGYLPLSPPARQLNRQPRFDDRLDEAGKLPGVPAVAEEFAESCAALTIALKASERAAQVRPVPTASDQARLLRPDRCRQLRAPPGEPVFDRPQLNLRSRGRRSALFQRPI